MANTLVVVFDARVGTTVPPAMVAFNEPAAAFFLSNRESEQPHPQAEASLLSLVVWLYCFAPF
jgi:hypothetical protein